VLGALKPERPMPLIAAISVAIVVMGRLLCSFVMSSPVGEPDYSALQALLFGLGVENTDYGTK
jgi:hypothetical protein